MHPATALHRLGGLAPRQTLLTHCTRREIEIAVATGAVVRDGRGRYSLPVLSKTAHRANAMKAAISHESAALWWGWEVARVPSTSHVTVPRNRNVLPRHRQAVTVHYATLGERDTWDGVVTSRERTLVDCLRTLPFAEALAIADSALRHQDVTPQALGRLASGLRGAGAGRARRVAGEATARSSGPFESVLRAIALDVPGLEVTPQFEIVDGGFYACPDLVDGRLRIVLEADSHAWHSSPAALRRDCRRYTWLTVLGYLVLRFAYADVARPCVRARGTGRRRPSGARTCRSAESEPTSGLSGSSARSSASWAR